MNFISNTTKLKMIAVALIATASFFAFPINPIIANAESNNIQANSTTSTSQVVTTETSKKEGRTGIITGSPVAIRPKKSTSSSVLSYLKRGDIVTVLETQGSWCVIKYKNGKAFVMKSFVNISDSPTTKLTTITTTKSTMTTTKPTTTTTTKNKATVTKTNVSPKSFASTTATTTTKSTTAKTTTTKNTQVTQKAQTLSSSATGYIVAAPVNIRKKPSLTSQKLGAFKENDMVNIIEKTGDWYKIIYNNDYAYVMTKFVELSSNGSSTTTTLSTPSTTLKSTTSIRNITTTASTTSTISTSTTTQTTTSATTQIKFAKSYYYVDKGKTIDFNFWKKEKNVKYTSSNKSNCPISSVGIVTGKKEGLYTITATNGSSSTSTCVVVLAPKNSNLSSMKISQKGIDFIIAWEGGGSKLSSGETVFKPYKDVSGYWTVGYGHAKTSAASKLWSKERAIEEFNKDIVEMIGEEYIMTKERPYLSKQAAKLLMNADMNSGPYVKAVSNWAIRNGVKLNQAQFDALVSFCYNLGPAYWNSDSKLFYLKSAIICHRNGSKADPEQIIDGFCRYIMSGGKNYKGLWYRRRNEAEMFIKGDYTIDRANKFTLPSNVRWS